MLAWRSTIFLLVLVVACAMAVVNVRYQARSAVVELEKARQQEQQLQVEWGALQVQQVAASKNDRIAEQVAKQNMQRVNPSITRYLLSDGTSPQTTVSTTAKAVKP
ncbi:cell division protein FtsL [Hydromonas duriensis]|uniref:Cell division protein FtsL n=1 Tax=Hydromonas duriensis TaxID=1527608 RepID=A0A4V3DJN7_9BURK|nr:cell division protein FtsL [Hydromonas duriensis]TDR30830.1 cell division protein FtsL [Hydromonas duriensis]